jgi:hypothetical protein
MKRIDVKSADKSYKKRMKSQNNKQSLFEGRMDVNNSCAHPAKDLYHHAPSVKEILKPMRMVQSKIAARTKIAAPRKSLDIRDADAINVMIPKRKREMVNLSKTQPMKKSRKNAMSKVDIAARSIEPFNIPTFKIKMNRAPYRKKLEVQQSREHADTKIADDNVMTTSLNATVISNEPSCIQTLGI